MANSEEYLIEFIGAKNYEDMQNSLIRFLRSRTDKFIKADGSVFQEFVDDDFPEIRQIGKFALSFSNDTENQASFLGTFVIVTLYVPGELTERRSKKRQFEKGKEILRKLFQGLYPDLVGGFFIFYDGQFHYRWSLIYQEPIGRKVQYSPYKRYTYFVSREQTNKTFIQRLRDINLSSLESIKEAFSVEKVTEEFFSAYRYALNEVLIKFLDGNCEYEKKHSFAQLLLSRILFIYFIQKKGWLKWRDYKQDTDYIRNLWLRYKDYVKMNKNKENSFYSWLSSLFFGAFNKKSEFFCEGVPEDIQESFRLMPFLNGGLFSQTELDNLELKVPDKIFEWLFEPDPSSVDKSKGFLQLFNFTNDESTPLDVEVAVDPEMLGRVYESLIAEEERGSSGIFYTPRTEIDFMCRMALIEYLANNTSISKDKIIDFVYTPAESVHNLKPPELKQLKTKLEDVKIVDPAVGSASFLVGMMNILVELHSAITKQMEGKEENIFALKRKIIQENLYGVDVKDWAVMVGELRLWLSLIIETDEKHMNIYTEPLLPNLSFKIRQGDSLVEEIGGVQISFRGGQQIFIPERIKSKIREIIDRKNAFYSGQRSADLKEIQEIEDLEQKVFADILEAKMEEIQRSIKKINQELKSLKEDGLFAGQHAQSKTKIKEKEKELQGKNNEINQYKNVLDSIRKKKKKDYFLWEVDFAEVFAEKGGFDIVIGNPPYVRQELIAPPLENPNEYSDEEWRKIKDIYKGKLISSVKNIWKEVKKINKRSDLYVYFYFHGLSLLQDGGIFCFINSNSWLDVAYGAELQEFLLRNMRPIYIIDNLKKRSFKQADVNTVIVLIQKPEKKVDDYMIKFVAFKKPFEEINNADIIKKIEMADKPIFDEEDFRIYPKSKRELLIEGIEIDEDAHENLPDMETNEFSSKYIGVLDY